MKLTRGVTIIREINTVGVDERVSPVPLEGLNEAIDILEDPLYRKQRSKPGGQPLGTLSSNPFS